MNAPAAVLDMAGHDGAERLRIGIYAIDPLGCAVTGPSGQTHIEPKIMSVLLVLAVHAGRVVTRAELIRQVWRVEYGGDESLTRAISILRRAFGDVRGEARYIETIPKTGYRLVAPVQWEPTVAPNGPAAGGQGSEAPPADKVASASGKPRRASAAGRFGGAFNRPGSMLAMALAALIAITAGVGWLASAGAPVLSRPSSEQGERVRVEPLRVPGAGLGGAGVSALGERAAAVLADRLSAYDVPTVLALDGARGGAADFVLSGAVVETGGDLQADLRFVDLASGSLVWSQRFERPAGKVDELIEELGSQASYAVECGFFRRRLLREPIGADLLGTIMRACMHAVGQERVAHYETALKLAEALPDEPSALSSSAFAAIRLADTPDGAQGRERLRAYARSAAEGALALEPGFPEALLALAELEPFDSWSRREALIIEALDADSQYPWSRSQHGRFLRLTGRLEEAAYAFDHTMAVKRGANHLAERGWLLALTGETGKALDLLARTEEEWPDNPLAPWRLFLMDAFGGELAAAQASLSDPRIARYVEQTGGKACWSVFLDAQRAGGSKDVTALDALCAADASGFHALRLAFLGEPERARETALALLQGSGEHSRLNMQMLLFYPAMAPARVDPRFMELAETVGLARYWLESGRWPDFCRREALAYDCREAAEAARALGGD